MLKELLLQFVLSILPVFIFQHWFNHHHHKNNQRHREMSIFMGITCCASMLLCMLTANDLFGIDLDSHFVPYTIGALYGGFPVLAALTIIYLLFQLTIIDSGWEFVRFFLFVFGYIPFVFFAIRPFQRASALRKRIYVLLLMNLVLVYFTVTIVGHLESIEVKWTIWMPLSILLAVTVFLAAAWISIFMIESVKEKEQLYNEVRRVSEDYRNEAEKLRQFIYEIPFAVVVVNCDGMIQHFNGMAKKLLSLRSEYREGSQLIGVPFTKALEPEQGKTIYHMLLQALNGKNESLIPYVSGDKTLTMTAFSLQSYTSNEIVGATLVVYDATEINRLRDEVGRMERLSLVGQMAASITHEIRNPMAVIRGFVQLIKERSQKSQQEYFRIIMEELDRANMIISDFLSLAQNRELKMELTSLNDIIRDLYPLLNADANLRGQIIEVDYQNNLPLLMLNEREMKQMILNLARNGMEAMGEKGVMRITTCDTADKIELRISDNGVGITPEQKKHLFEPFFTTKTRGTGLGLPLCLSIVERHHGTIDVESTEGEGTTFVVAFFKTNLAEAINTA